VGAIITAMSKHAKEPGLTVLQRLGAALLVSNLLSAVLFAIRVGQSQNLRYWFLLWNLVLAWVPLGLVILLRERLKFFSWSSWQSVGLTLLWLVFLPNSFYLFSDLIHLHASGEVSIIFDVVMFVSFIFNGFLAGYSSLYVMHNLLLSKMPRMSAHSIIGLVLFICSFAIYFGRDLRWNSWDVMVNPAGILFDVSERVISPLTHTEVFSTTALVFLLLGTIYIVAWQFVAAVKAAAK